MMQSVVYLDKYHWRVSIYILEQCGEGAEVAEALSDAGCRGSDLLNSLDVINSCDTNVGLTYTNQEMRNSIVMVGLQDDRAEFVNTIHHELFHVISHICQKDHIDNNSEEAAYLAGDIGEAVYVVMNRYRL